MQSLVAKIPEFCLSHWLLRVPLIVVFFQQGIDKLPVDVDTAEAYELPYLVWWFVVWGEVGAALGLLFGGVLMIKDYLKELGDLVTRFSGITICSIMTGVIWMSKPESVLDVVLYDHFHLMLWVGGLFFALRGNRG
jgi:putative oxidoreductase